MIRKRAWLPLAALGVVLIGCPVHMRAGVVSARFNDLTIGIDEQTGNIVLLFSPATGDLLVASPDSAGLVDLAYPTKDFAPPRLASRFSRARIARTNESLTIKWDALGFSRPNVSLPHGSVRAEVQIRAAANGRSVVLTCHVDNKSDAAVPQELFPDLHGLMPFVGISRTELRLPRAVVYPFTVPFRASEVDPPYYDRIGWRYYEAGGYYHENALRWLDYGSRTGVYALIKTQLCDCQQLFIATHSFEFYNLIREWADEPEDNNLTKKPQSAWKKCVSIM